MELQPIYEKSFYGKATVENIENEIILKSYKTKVASIKSGKAVIYKDELMSKTTLRHIRAFLYKYGFEWDLTKKELLQRY